MNGVEPETPAKAGRTASEQPDGNTAGAGLFEGANALLNELRGVAYDYLLLIGLETKRAGQSLIVMIAAGVMMAILVVSAWLGLVAAAVAAMIGAGVAPWLALTLAVVANLVVAAALYALIHFKRRYLAFPATMRNLKPRAPAANGRRGVH